MNAVTKRSGKDPMTIDARARRSTVPRESVSWRGCSVPLQIHILTARALRALWMDPRLLLVSVASPLIMLLILSQVFTSISETRSFPGGVDYIQFLLPAIMIMGVLQSGMGSGAALCQEIKNGFVHRMRTLPVWPGSVLLGRSASDLLRSLIQLSALSTAAHLLFSFHAPGGAVGVAVAMLIALMTGNCLGWVFIAMACWFRNAEVMQTFSGLMMFALMFGTNAFVPLDGLPDWLRSLSHVNPMTYAITAARGWILGDPDVGVTLYAVLGSVVVALPCALLAVKGFARPLGTN